MPILSNQAAVEYMTGANRTFTASNTALFALATPCLRVTKTQCPTSGPAGTVVTFTVTLTNTDTSLNATSVTVTDDLELAGYTYLPGTVKIGGKASSLSPLSGIVIPLIAPGASVTVTFDGQVI